MDGFPLSRQKLKAQPEARRHKIICQWLREIHAGILEKRLSFDDLRFVADSYRKALDWLGIAADIETPPDDPRFWIEFISDRFHYHQELSAKGLSEHNLLPKIRTGDKAKNTPWQPEIPYKAALDNLRSAFNVGSIFRVVDAVAFETVIVGGTTPDKAHHQVQKASMGACDWVPQEIAVDLPAVLRGYKMSGLPVVGIETAERSENYLRFSWPPEGVIVMGNEEYGLSQAVLRECTDFVHIPMFGKKNSINVANAFSVIAFHIVSILKRP